MLKSCSEKGKETAKLYTRIKKNGTPSGDMPTLVFPHDIKSFQSDLSAAVYKLLTTYLFSFVYLFLSCSRSRYGQGNLFTASYIADFSI